MRILKFISSSKILRNVFFTIIGAISAFLAFYIIYLVGVFVYHSDASKSTSDLDVDMYILIGLFCLVAITSIIIFCYYIGKLVMSEIKRIELKNKYKRDVEGKEKYRKNYY